MTVASRTLSAGFGLLMVAAAASQAYGMAVSFAALAAAAVLAGMLFRPAATVAVLSTVTTIVLSDPAPMFAALSGLAATAYLVLRHGDGAVTATAPTMLAVVGFTAVAAIATALPMSLPWLPLAAPLALLVVFLLAVRPFLGAQRP